MNGQTRIQENYTYYRNHMYVATCLVTGMRFESVNFSDVTKQIRKYVKLRHGNKLRTYLLENGVVHAEGEDRRPNHGGYYNFEITIERWN